VDTTPDLAAAENHNFGSADAGCQRPGWFIEPECCVFVHVERAGPDAVL